MAETRKRISLEEFTDNVSRIMEHVIHEQEAVLVERADGELVEVKPVTAAHRRARTDAPDLTDDEAFLSAAGGWSDVDIDAFLRDIYTSRRSSRPPVEL